MTADHAGPGYCEVCKVRSGECVNLANPGQPLPNRRYHVGRGEGVNSLAECQPKPVAHQPNPKEPTHVL